MAKLTRRKAVMLTPEEMKWLEALASVNTSGNESEFLRALLRRVIVNPEKFGMIGALDFRKAPIRETALAT